MRLRRPWPRPAAALLCVLLATTPASAQVTLVPATWTTFAWFSGVGPIDDPFDGFFLSVLDPTRLRVTDAFFTGDAFDVFINGSLLLSTPSVPAGTDTGAGDGDAAWADARLSKGEVLLAPGDYRIDIFVRDDAGFGFGDGFIRADAVEAQPPAVVPEPASLLLLATGLLGLACGARARQRRGDKRLRAPLSR